MNILYVGFLAGLTLLGGCVGDLPRIPSVADGLDERRQSTRLWDSLASHFAEDIAGKYARLPADTKRPLYVNHAESTPFSKAFRTFLIERLSQRGLPIAARQGDLADGCGNATESACEPLQLRFDTQVVKYASRDGRAPISLVKGTAYLMYLIGDLWAFPAYTILPLSDYYREIAAGGTNTEVVVSASLRDGDSLLMTTHNIYYVDDRDAFNYEERYVGPSFGSPVALSPKMRHQAVLAAQTAGCEGSKRLSPTRLRSDRFLETYEFQCDDGDMMVRCATNKGCAADL